MENSREGLGIIAGAHGLSSVEEFKGKEIVFVGTNGSSGFRTEAVILSLFVRVDSEDWVEVAFGLEGRPDYLLVRGIQTKG